MGKRAYLYKLLQDLRASYWFLPSILVFVGLILASVMGWIDQNPDMVPFTLPDSLLDTQADGARSTLAVIAQSIIGVTGVMFSMTLVAVSFASGNFGPRLIGNFMRDRGNQISLGILIATFVYALTVLRTVQDGNEGDVLQYVPQYSILMALALALLCIFTLIYFVHHVPETINVSRISASIGARLEHQIKHLIDAHEDAGTPPDIPHRAPDDVITSDTSGYIQTVNFDQLNDLAEDNDWQIRMASAIGAFVTCETHVFDIWSNDPISDSDHAAIQGCFAVGASRTENQNPTFLAEQLVEMVARALSPGVNDPYTAMDCLNRLAAALTVAACYEGGLQDPAHPRVSFDHLSFDRLFAASFPLCRQYIKPDALTLQHARVLLDNLHEVARSEDRAIIQTEIEMLSTTH
ncbi:DUF2254 domain-containing protein [Roseobacter sp. CCS2]|uniref:DUF2254 domain-containing protein n=1 Tax=Roseobacter sp. CCS2 TaxID=391593 RepID=UPI0002DDB6EE|nr:DUF2254 domain-containing protein [Roseobacter sp. CCS2]